MKLIIDKWNNYVLLDNETEIFVTKNKKCMETYIDHNKIDIERLDNE